MFSKETVKSSPFSARAVAMRLANAAEKTFNKTDALVDGLAFVADRTENGGRKFTEGKLVAVLARADDARKVAESITTQVSLGTYDANPTLSRETKDKLYTLRNEAAAARIAGDKDTYNVKLAELRSVVRAALVASVVELTPAT